jgi:predicted small secreted protein
MNRMIRALQTALLASSLALSACATEVGVPAQGEGGKDAQGLQQAFTRFPDLPVPEGADIDLDRTLVFGAGKDWFGRLVIGVSHSANDMFDYFKRELPRFGWEEVTSVRSAVSVLTYARQERVATIQIEGSKFRGSHAVITVSPRGRPHPPAAPPAAAAGAAGKLPLKKIR